MAPFCFSLILACLANLAYSAALSVPSTDSYTLSPSFRVTKHPTVRKYTLVVSNITGAPDGVERPVFAINGQFPGPLIEVNSFDTLSIAVTNFLNDPLTIHWHGLHQNGSSWEDGVSGVTSCPIATNTSYTYVFRLNGQSGTFWYHAHSLGELADGVVGPLIVHDAQSPTQSYTRGHTHGPPGGHTTGHTYGQTHGHTSSKAHGYTSSPTYAHTSATHGHASSSNYGHTSSPTRGHTSSPTHAHTSSKGHGNGHGYNHGHARGNTGKNAKAQRDFVLHLSDWYHDTSDVIITALKSPTGYNGSSFAPPPHSVLINGVGRFNCSFVRPGERCDAFQAYPEFVVGAGASARFRLIGGTSLVMFHVSVDGHALNVIEADATLVNGPKGIQRVPIWGGQRYSFTINTTAEDAGKSFWIRATTNLNCLNWIPLGLEPTTYAILRVPFANGTLPTGLPTTQDWPFVSGSASDPLLGPCYASLESWQLPPLTAPAVPAQVAGRRRYNADFVPRNATVAVDLGKFFINTISSMTQPWKPLLNELLASGDGILGNVTSVLTLPNPEWYDIVLVNQDPVAHSFHLHSLESHVVAQGPGDPTDAQLDSIIYNITSPVRRDTVVIDGPAWMVIRVRADIPGVWFLHCHIAWHLSLGFAGVVVVQPNAIHNFTVPQKTLDLCNAAPPDDEKPVIPGRRSLPMSPPALHPGTAASKRAAGRWVVRKGDGLQWS